MTLDRDNHEVRLRYQHNRFEVLLQRKPNSLPRFFYYCGPGSCHHKTYNHACHIFYRYSAVNNLENPSKIPLTDYLIGRPLKFGEVRQI